MYDKFNAAARAAIRRARDLVHERTDSAIGTEHILLGILDGPGAELLKDVVDLQRLRAELDAVAERGKGPNLAFCDPPPFTPAAKRVLETCFEEAWELKQDHIGPEHLLLSLVDEEHGIALEALTRCGVDAVQLRERIIRGLGGDPSLARRPRPGWRVFPASEPTVMALARAHAARRNDRFIGTEHLLIALLDHPNGVASDMLARLGIDGQRLRERLEQRAQGSFEGDRQGPSLPMTPGARRALELALEEASERGHRNLHAGHLLLGLIREGDEPASRLLAGFGVTIEAARKVLKE